MTTARGDRIAPLAAAGNRTVPLAAARCDLHPEREAAVRCPECRRDYCRECVAEHSGRLLCTPCLRRLAGAGVAPDRRRVALRLARAAALGGALVAGWLGFVLLGRVLLALPVGVEPPSATASDTPDASESGTP